MEPMLVLLGVLVAVPGALALVRPTLVARWDERRDAVGSRRNPGDVEPTQHRVGTMRYVGFVVLLVSAALVAAGLVL